MACIIYIGNIIDEENCGKLKHKLKDKLFLSDTMEKNFGQEKCTVVAQLLEEHICLLLEKYKTLNPEIRPLIENIKSYIDANLEYDIDVAHIAAFFHYNKLYLGRIFKKETGLTVHEYINKKRLEKAKLLFLDSEYSVIDISNEVGFNNVTYFNRLFKKLTGMTPSEYRRHCMNKYPPA